MDVNCAVHVLQISSTQKWKNRHLKQCPTSRTSFAPSKCFLVTFYSNFYTKDVLQLKDAFMQLTILQLFIVLYFYVILLSLNQ